MERFWSRLGWVWPTLGRVWPIVGRLSKMWTQGATCAGFGTAGMIMGPDRAGMAQRWGGYGPE